MNILLSIAMSLKKRYNEEGDSMPKKREIKIELNAKEEARAHYEMEWNGERMNPSKGRQQYCTMQIKEQKQ